jgi:hypothetical protein
MPKPTEQPRNEGLFPNVLDVLGIDEDAKFIETMEKLTGE